MYAEGECRVTPVSGVNTLIVGRHWNIVTVSFICRTSVTFKVNIWRTCNTGPNIF